MSNPSIYVQPPTSEGEPSEVSLCDPVPWAGGCWTHEDAMKLFERSTVFVVVEGKNDGTEDGQGSGRESKEGEEEEGKNTNARSAEQKAKGAGISAWSYMGEEKLARNKGSVELAGRIQMLKKFASVLTRDHMNEAVRYIIDGVMTNGESASHTWRVVDNMSMEGLDLVDLGVVATCYKSGGVDSEELSKDDQ